MAWQRFNTGRHGQSLHFGQPDANGARTARHAKGKFQVYPLQHSAETEWRACLTSTGQEQEIGIARSCGLAMSLCAQWLESH